MILVRREDGYSMAMGLTTKPVTGTASPARWSPVPDPAALGLTGQGFLWGHRLTRISVLDVRAHIGGATEEVQELIECQIHLPTKKASWSGDDRRTILGDEDRCHRLLALRGHTRELDSRYQDRQENKLSTAILVVAVIVLAILAFAAWAAANRARTNLVLHQVKYPHTAKELLAARADSVSRSRSTVSGRVIEQLAPFFPEWPVEFNPRDAHFIANPVDFVIFDGLDKGGEVNVALVEVKTGMASRG
jgi:hypothetical protein